MYPSDNSNYSKWIKRLVIVVAVLVVLVGAYQIYLNRHFRIVSTSPKTSNVAAISPFLKINFNRQLSTKDLSVSSSYSVVSSYKVEGKSLVLNLKSPMTAGYKYWVKVNYIADTKGEVLTNKTLVFTPKNIAWQNLSKDQQTALLSTQNKPPVAASGVRFDGMGSLVSVGVSNSQIASLQDDLIVFAPKASTVTIDKNSVVAVPHNRNSASTTDTVNFTLKVDGQAYKARLDYSYLSDDARLYLYDASGAQVFDSQNIPKSD